MGIVISSLSPEPLHVCADIYAAFKDTHTAATTVWISSVNGLFETKREYGTWGYVAGATPMFVYDHPTLTQFAPDAFSDGLHVFISRALFERHHAANTDKWLLLGESMRALIWGLGAHNALAIIEQTNTALAAGQYGSWGVGPKVSWETRWTTPKTTKDLLRAISVNPRFKNQIWFTEVVCKTLEYAATKNDAASLSLLCRAGASATFNDSAPLRFASAHNSQAAFDVLYPASLPRSALKRMQADNCGVEQSRLLQQRFEAESQHKCLEKESGVALRSRPTHPPSPKRKL